MQCLELILAGILLLIGLLPHWVRGHGYLIEPPGRSSLWRLGYDVPANYNDNSLRCGGSRTKCGVCGDPFQGPKDNEAGGKYAKGVIARTYKQGETISITVVVTANHRGHFEFHLCPHNDVNSPVTEECLMGNVLTLADGGTRYFVPGNKYGRVHIKAHLPEGISCSQCVLRWKWRAGNSWGRDVSGRGCLGCGPQEHFYGCADIAIDGNESNQGVVEVPVDPNPAAGAGNKRSCHAVNNWAGNDELDKWCDVTCNGSTSCPPVFCACE